MFTGLLANREFFQRSNQCPEIRPHLGPAEKLTQPIQVRGKDVLAYVSGQVIVAYELGYSWKGLGHCRDEGFTQIVYGGQRRTPVPAYILEDSQDFIVVLRADLTAFQDLTAERVDTQKKHLASSITSAVDMEDVAASVLHGGSQQAGALLMDDLKVRHKLPRQVAYRTLLHFDAAFAGDQEADLLTLAAFTKTSKADPDKNVVRKIGSGSNDA
jgi:hypothetical protein